MADTAKKFSYAILPSGTVLLSKKATKDTLKKTPRQVKLISEAILTTSRIQTKLIREILDDMLTDIFDRVLDDFDHAGGVLYLPPSSDIKKSSRPLIEEAIDRIQDVIQNGLTDIVGSVIIGYKGLIEKNGLTIPRGMEKKLIKYAIKSLLRFKYTKNGLDFEERLSLVANKIAQIIAEHTPAITSPEGLEKVKARIEDYVSTPDGLAPKHISIPKTINRIVRTEISRVKTEVALGLFYASGIPMAYWRLSEEHPWQGGLEICEMLAEGTGPDIPDNMDIEISGLYTIKNYPKIPHPYCMCSPEPVFVKSA